MKKLDDIFNLDPEETNNFSEDKPKTKNEIVETKSKTVSKTSSDKLSIQDEDYIRDELKDMVAQGKDVLKTLRNDIAIGSPPRMYEVYADLMRATFENLRELRDLNSEVIKTEYKKVGGEKNVAATKTTNNLILSSSELLKMVNDAKEKNSVKEVKAEFDFEDRNA